MLYIHRTACISPQQSFGEVDIERLNESVENKLHAVEPKYEGIPPGLLRRMGKAVRIGVGAALPLIKQSHMPDGIIIGTANGGMEDCIKFLNQIIEYEEGMLTPGNFVQSTPNAIASQVSLMTANKNYNITHVHRGLAFENAIIDALMHVRENPSHSYLLGAVDEISAYNYNIDYLDGWYKRESVSNKTLYTTNSPASLAGEGAAMFLVSGKPENAIAKLSAMHTIHTGDEDLVREQLKNFVANNLTGNQQIDLFITGENGDNRLQKYYDACEDIVSTDTTIARFKHMSGEFPTASALALWIACWLVQHQQLPSHMIKKSSNQNQTEQILIYNNYKGTQHSFMLVSKI
ncbi:MAG: beta-ketoacyl synthase chain length factor [Bacteroidetes bacterium]|nr:beta-ketoacyl synthase chain length factor [Bacteroidota bacterium]